MPEDQVELEHIPPVREVKLGEWFCPFMNYENVAYKINNEDEKSKEFPFIIEPIGKFTLELGWSGPNLLLIKKLTGIVIFPFGEEVIDLRDIHEFEEKIESRLVQMAVFCEDEKYINKNIPYRVEIVSPNKKVFVSNFSSETLDAPVAGMYMWHEKDKGEKVGLLIPEVENILEKIQIRIVQKETS